MGPKSRYLIFLVLIFPAELFSQDTLDYRTVDSLTYSYYFSGNWASIISLGNTALSNGIDYKYLRQRLGYAYFSEGKYYDSKLQYEKALAFDNYDQSGLEYLYYSYLNTGKDDWAGSLAGRMDTPLRKRLFGQAFRPLEGIDLEYNFKFAGTSNRSNPQYYRIGIYTRAGYRLSFYQSFSKYNQIIRIQHPLNSERIFDDQSGYYVLMKWNVSRHLLLKTAFHLLYSSSNPANSGELGYVAFSRELNRFSLEAYGSYLTIERKQTFQTGLKAGFTFPGRSSFYLSGTISELFEDNLNRIIYNQKAGMKAGKKLWIEVNTTMGHMSDYNDYDGLYVYYSFDPLAFRSGVTTYFYITKKIMVWLNYSYERKEYYEDKSFHYNQFSYLGGIKWKL
jgi:hypothetical protein